MKEFKGNTGAKIVINEASMKDVKKLRQCLANELKEHEIDLSGITSLTSLMELGQNNPTKLLNFIKDVLCSLEGSDEFTEIIYKCMKECTYDGIMITESLFDDKIEAREDYDHIVMEVIKVNLSPFFKSLSGKLATLKNAEEKDQA